MAKAPEFVKNVDRDEVSALLAASEAHALLLGPRGVGKTTDAYRARHPAQSLFISTLTNEQSAAALVGHFVPVEGAVFKWHDGPALRAWREGGLWIINEIDQASPDVMDVLHVLLDDPEVAELTLPTSESIRPAPGFRAIATTNGKLSDLAPAVQDRFCLVIRVDRPSREQLALLPHDVRRVCERLYANCAPGGEPRFTYRALRNFARLRERLGDARKAALLVTEDGEQAHALVEALLMAG